MNKQDFLGECNDHGLPLDEFQQTFCVRCLQPECTRSIAGKAKFDQRVSTWHDRLFASVPRLDPQDPRYKMISTQKFINVETGRTPEVRSAWVDPNEAPAPEPSILQGSPPIQTPAPVPPAPSQTPREKIVLPPNFAAVNAPSQAGKMLGSGRITAPSAPDAWNKAEPAPNTVTPGTKVKLGRSGV